MTSNNPNLPSRDFRLERFLQVNVALMTALGAVLLGTGQMGTHSVLLSIMAVFAAVTAVIFTDILGWFRINRTLANVAAIAAVGFSLTDFFGNEAEYQLLAVANLLVYLQIVLLYQEKNERIFWQLMVLSLLQVVVSAALNLGFQFGVLIVAYMFVAFSAMGLFFFYRESFRFFATDGSGKPKLQILRPDPGRARRRRRRGRWPLKPKARPLAFQFSGNLAEILQGRGLLRLILSMGLTTLLFTVFFFFALPRISNSVWQGPQGPTRSVVGFSQEVTLDDMSELFESEEVVMRVSFFDQKTNEPVRLMSGPYLRGSVLVHYYCGSGKWRQIQWTQRYRGQTLPGPPPNRDVVRQEIKLQPQPNPVLFGTYPIYHVPGTPNSVKIDPATRQLIRDNFERAPRATFQYALGTSGIEGGQQQPLHAAGRHYDDVQRTFLKRFEPQLCPTIERVARETVAAQAIPDDDAYRKALALEDHFHELGRYAYSLNQLGVERQEGVDPVEDFVANHRTGHCEYFASALVLMLRSQGIPARMVVGYRAFEYNTVGDFYQVREKEAHAWAEAFLEYDQVPEALRQQVGITSKGAWLRLEPTPIMAELDDDEVALTLWDRVVEWKNYTQGLWSDYVLGLNAERQQESIYTPFFQRLGAGVRKLLDPRTWQRWLAAIASWGLGSLLGVVVTVVCLLLALWAGWRLLRYLRRKFKWRFARRAGKGRVGDLPSSVRRHERVDFYEKLEALLARYGVRRPNYQTQREFAVTAAGRLAAVPESRRATSLATRIVDAFYRVRFGRRPLPEDQSQAVEAALGELDHALSERQDQPPADPPEAT